MASPLPFLFPPLSLLLPCTLAPLFFSNFYRNLSLLPHSAASSGISLMAKLQPLQPSPPHSPPLLPNDYALQEAGELPVLGGPHSVPSLGLGSGSSILLILSAPPPGRRAPKASGREFSMKHLVGPPCSYMAGLQALLHFSLLEQWGHPGLCPHHTLRLLSSSPSLTRPEDTGR